TDPRHPARLAGASHRSAGPVPAGSPGTRCRDTTPRGSPDVAHHFAATHAVAWVGPADHDHPVPAGATEDPVHLAVGVGLHLVIAPSREDHVASVPEADPIEPG